MELNLLAPQGTDEQLRENYIHQLRQTVDAYLPSFVFVGEALQNALDAVRQAAANGRGAHTIHVTMDFTTRRVTVSDTGDGFPDAPNLLFLGGGRKAGLKLAGMVGVGLKVVLFSSDNFELRSRRADGTTRVTIDGACDFAADNPPSLHLDDPTKLPSDDDPMPEIGTVVSFTFPAIPDGEGIPERYIRDVLENCTNTTKPDFTTSIQNAINSKPPKQQPFPSRLAALIAADLRRHSYLGSTSRTNEFDRVKVTLTIIGDEASLGPVASEYADGQTSVTVDVTPKYFTVHDSLAWATGKKPHIVERPLGDGGSNLERAESQFNVTSYTRADEYEQLVTNSRGKATKDLERYKRLLFPRIRSIMLTIGRIDPLKIYLPGGPRRVISARGVSTQHDIDVYTGQNQQYVRCFDIVIDVDGDLNYGKTHLTDTHLVANVRAFVNDAYRDTIQNAAKNLVGKVKTDEPTEDKFWQRPDLGVDDLREKKVPRDENDVIALLFELVGKGHFPEFDWYGLSQRDTYDARAYFRDMGSPMVAESQKDLKIIEFKLHGASVARDFDTADDKDINRVDLVICYEVGTSPVSSYQVVSIEDSALGSSSRAIYPGVTHVLFDTQSGKVVQILPLREYVRDHFPPADPAALPHDVEESD